jgi:hypothetical protein
MRTVRLQVLGGFSMEGPAGKWLGSRRPLDVEMAYVLALDRHVAMSTAALAAALWPGMGERWAAHRLAQLRLRLQQRVGVPIVDRSTEGWKLDPEQVSCDLWELEAAPLPDLLFGDLISVECAASQRYEQARLRVEQARRTLLAGLQA